MRSGRRKKLIIILLLLIGIGSISIGFSAFSSDLKISTGLAVNPNQEDFSVKFSSDSSKLATDPVEPSSKSNGLSAKNATIVNSATPTIGGYSAVFTQDGQYVTYSFYVRNTGNYVAYLNSIIFYSDKTCTAKTGTDSTSVSDNCESVNTSITVKVGNIITTETKLDITGESLEPNESKLVEVTFEYLGGGSVIGGDFSIQLPSISLYYDSSNQYNTPQDDPVNQETSTSTTEMLVLSDVLSTSLINYKIYGSSAGVGESVDDSYVIPITVRGTNLLDLSKGVLPSTTPHVKYTYDNSTGTLNLTSTPTAYDYVFFYLERDLKINFKVGKTYYFGADAIVSGKKSTTKDTVLLFGIAYTNSAYAILRQPFLYNDGLHSMSGSFTYTGTEENLRMPTHFNYGSNDPAYVKYEKLYLSDFDRYEPYVTPTNVNITISSPLMEGDYIDFMIQSVVRSDGTKESVNIPTLTTLSVPTTVIEVGTTNTPSKIEATYFKN